MNEDLIERIWQEAPEEQPMSQAQLVAVLEPRVARSSRVLQNQVRAFLFLQMVTLLLAGANLFGYRSNPVMLGVEAAIAVGALALAAYGVRLHGEVCRLDRRDETLVASLRHKLTFYRKVATTWMWLTALSVAAFTFALNSLIDNTDGSYVINHPPVFAGVQVAMVLLIFVSFRVAHEPRLREMRAVLSDLEAQILDRTETVDGDLQRLRMWQLALVVLLTALLALGVWVANS